MPSELPPIWVVSLERATDRRAFVEQAFAEAGLSFDVFPAVDGQALSPTDLSTYSSRRAMYEYGRDLSRGELGASLSHLRVLERMVTDHLPELVVFEDDARPDPRFGDVLRARDKLPSDADVVTFHSLFAWATPTPVGSAPLLDDYWVCQYARTPMGVQAYLITLDAARRVLDVGYPIGLPADELLLRPRPAGLHVYGIEPTLIAHAEFPSEIRAPAPPVAIHGRGGRAMLELVRIAGKARRRVERHRSRFTPTAD